jgi:predicted Zn-dependent peptidase
MGMKRIVRFFLLALLVLAAASLAGPAPAQDEDLYKHPQDMKFPPLSFTPPQVSRAYLSNGMTVYLLEDPELPLINLSLLIRTGSIHDPAAQAGLAKLTAAVLRNGGTADQSPQEINEALESMAVHLEFGMNRESGAGSLSVQKKDFPKALAIFSRLLMRPDFRSEQLDLAKKQEIEAIRRSNDDPEEIAYREFRRALYAGNPRGWVPTLASVEKIQRSDLLAFHRKFFRPNQIFLGVSGDFKKEEMMAELERAFQDWERSTLEIPFIPSPIPSDSRAVCYVPKDLPQATILLGHLSIPVDHPDHLAFKMANFILGGGGFNSRLTQEIRSNQGLSYGVGSFYQGRVGYGVFGAFCQTKSSSVHRAISLLYEIIEGIKRKKPSLEEMEWAKNTLTNQFIFSFASSASLVSQKMQLAYDGLPEDYLEKYPQRLAAITLEDLDRAVERHLHPENALLIVVGKEENFDGPLSSFGTVKRIDLPKYD